MKNKKLLINLFVLTAIFMVGNVIAHDCPDCICNYNGDDNNEDNNEDLELSSKAVFIALGISAILFFTILGIVYYMIKKAKEQDELNMDDENSYY